MSDLKVIASAFHSCGETKTVTVNGHSLHVWQVTGSTETIVFLHGNSSCKEAFHNQMRYFSKLGYSLLAVDLPGHGLSADAPDEPSANELYTIPGYARIVWALLQYLNIQNPLLVGWSLGGHIAIEMKGQNAAIKGLCISGTPPMGPGAEDFGKAFLPAPSAALTTRRHATGAEINAYTKDMYGSLAPIADYFHSVAHRADGRARARMGEHWASATDGYNQQKIVRQINTPLLVFHGEEDVFISQDFVENITWGNLWQDKIILIPTVGHAPFLEIPDQFNETLQAFTGTVFSL